MRIYGLAAVLRWRPLANFAPMPDLITSIKNPRVKQLMALERSRERRETGLFVVEGVREVSLCIKSGYMVRWVFVCPEVYSDDAAYPIPLDEMDVTHVSAEVFARVAYRGGTGGIIAVVEYRSFDLADLPSVDNPLFVVLEKVEKPGNIGAVLRTADAAGVTAVIVCDPATDLFNPNVIRSGLGCLFTVPTIVTDTQQLQEWFREHGVRTCAAALKADAVTYHSVDMSGPTAIVLGSESDGLSEDWLSGADVRMVIPMRGSIDSMNVSNAAAVLVFEALRQRGQ